ncbi:hypothetical protein Tco_0471475 [Tanacetum coccineum]
MGDENPIRTLGDYSKPSHEGYRNTIELPVGNNVIILCVSDFNETTCIAVRNDTTSRIYGLVRVCRAEVAQRLWHGSIVCRPGGRPTSPPDKSLASYIVHIETTPNNDKALLIPDLQHQPVAHTYKRKALYAIRADTLKETSQYLAELLKKKKNTASGAGGSEGLRRTAVISAYETRRETRPVGLRLASALLGITVTHMPKLMASTQWITFSSLLLSL